jgi:hypothetical protein
MTPRVSSAAPFSLRGGRRVHGQTDRLRVELDGRVDNKVLQQGRQWIGVRALRAVPSRATADRGGRERIDQRVAEQRGSGAALAGRK